jgi:hypothetical protein
MTSNWACAACGRGFTRKSSAKRHVDNVHHGFASYVTWSDYLSGRTLGYYPPGEPPKRGTPKQPRSPVDQAIDAFWNGYFDEMGRIAARNRTTPAPQFSHASTTSQYTINPFGDNDIFGIRSYVCSNCLGIKPGSIHFVSNERGGFRDQKLYCSSATSQDVTKFGAADIKEYAKKRKKDLKYVLLHSINAWTNYQAELISVKIDDPNRYDGFITFAADLASSKKKLYITLEYSDKKCIALDPTTNNSTWAIRAIKNGRTTINQEELVELVEKTENLSYGFFKIISEKAESIYLLAVAKNGVYTSLKVKDYDAIQIPQGNQLDGQKLQSTATTDTHAHPIQNQVK